LVHPTNTALWRAIELEVKATFKELLQFMNGENYTHHMMSRATGLLVAATSRLQVLWRTHCAQFVWNDFGNTKVFPYNVNQVNVTEPIRNLFTENSRLPWHDKLGKYIAQEYEMFLLQEDHARAMHRFYYPEHKYNPPLMDLEHISPQVAQDTIARPPTIGDYLANNPDDRLSRFTALQIEWRNVYNLGNLCLLHKSINRSIGNAAGADKCRIHFSVDAQVDHVAARSNPILYPPENPTPEFISLSAAKLSTQVQWRTEQIEERRRLMIDFKVVNGSGR